MRGFSHVNGDPFVSVIIPAYNAESTISETVSSVLQQTLTNFELIIINDGSTDKTASLIEEKFGRDSRIAIINQKNRGVSETRNIGISASRCELIAPLDADDLWHPTYLEKQVKSINKLKDAGLVYAWSRYIDRDGKIIWTPGYPVMDGKIFGRQLYWNIVGNGSAILFRKSAALEFGGYDSRVTPTADLMLQLKIASRYPIGVTPEYLVGYRQYDGQTSSDANLMYRSWIRTLEIVRDECKAVPECAINWKMGELHFGSATRAYLDGNWRKAARLMLLAGRSDPVGTCVELVAFAKQQARHFLGRVRRALVPIKASSTQSLFLEGRPDEFVLPREPILRHRRLKYLRHLDEAAGSMNCARS